MNIPRIETPRLILREWKEPDFKPFAQLNGDSTVMEFFPRKLTQDQSNEMAARIQKDLETKGYGLWATEVKSTGEFIGFIGLNNLNFEAFFTPNIEIGWRLKKSAWGQGFAPEGARAALQFGFDKLELPQIVAITSTPNLRSMRVMEKIGMNRDPKEDFDHPRIEPGNWLQRHVLYRKLRGPA